MVLGRGGDGRLAVLFNRSAHEVAFRLPPRAGHHWEEAARGRHRASARARSHSSTERPGSRGAEPAARRNRPLRPPARTP